MYWGFYLKPNLQYLMIFVMASQIYDWNRRIFNKLSISWSLPWQPSEPPSPYQ